MSAPSISYPASGRCRKTPAARGARAMIGARFRARGIGARFFPAFCAERAGRRGGSSSPASSPTNSQPAGLLPALTATGAAAAANAPNYRTFAGASGRNSHKPVSCGGTGCVLVSAAVPAVGRRKNGKRRTPKCPIAALNTRHGLASNSRQYASAGLHLSPLSGGPSTCGQTGESAPQAERHERRMGHQSADTLTSSALTADPRRADPGNPLAGAVLVLRRLSIMCNWPVALRGGGHIAGVA